ncbi:uncharacterized protein EAF01_003734 [Botrytis porri]|uniref:Uncharacterized protein n=1 Tax=Botrytis porri TaxID=87229 RepID=A0A4Z1L0V6_9HELO|nr:uncharacterized protein EAF01_003734 [Botrytis porri]KAF7910016.1 hypothetical protein EAF01_003734 [Botrytis porri]TGO90361.1 hypothetical protein BPOR_0067g00030 [Botrytis porri]
MAFSELREYPAPMAFRCLDSVPIGQERKRTIYEAKNETNKVKFVLFNSYPESYNDYKKGLHGWVCYPCDGEWATLKHTNFKCSEKDGALVAHLTQAFSYALRDTQMETSERWKCRQWNTLIKEWMADWSTNVDAWYPGEKKLSHLAKSWQPTADEDWDVVKGYKW